MGQRILVAEDEMIVAFDLSHTIEEAGYEIVGPHAGICSAMLAFQKEKPQLAILDVSLNDGSVFALAKVLAQEDVPIIFHSGSYTPDEIAQHFPNATTLVKPCPPAEMLRAVHKLI